jgi:hypothetical protein
MLMGLSALALVAVSGISAAQLHQRMIEDRVDKLQSLVLTVRGGAEYLEQQVQAGRLTRDQAIAELRDQLHKLALRQQGRHGGDPNREGKPTTAKDAQGRSSADLAREALRSMRRASRSSLRWRLTT